MIPGVGQTNVPGMQPRWAQGMAHVPQPGMGQGFQQGMGQMPQAGMGQMQQSGMGQGQGGMPGMWQQQQQQRQKQLHGVSQGANAGQSGGSIDQNLLNQVLGNADLMNLLGAVSTTHQSSQQGVDGAGNGDVSNADDHVGGGGEEELSEENKTPCVFFNTPQGCRQGNKCKFLHQTS